MSKKPTDRETLTPSLPFPAPAGFGEPIAYLTVAVNALGQPHIFLQGNREQGLYFAGQALNYAVNGIVVECLQRSLAEAALGPWPQVRKEGNS